MFLYMFCFSIKKLNLTTIYIFLLFSLRLVEILGYLILRDLGLGHQEPKIDLGSPFYTLATVKGNSVILKYF